MLYCITSMHSQGHFGVSMSLCAPILFVSIVTEMYIVGALLCGLMLMFSSTPDIDLKLPWVSHRGFTHTVHFAVLFGALVSIVSYLAFTTVEKLVVVEYIIELSVLSSIVQVSSVIFVGSAFGIIAHLVGDILTPTGVHLFSRSNNFGYSLNVCNADSKIGNHSIVKLGFITVGITVISGVLVVMNTLPLINSVIVYLCGYILVYSVWGGLMKFYT